MKDCASCNHHRAGPLSGWLYCLALHDDPRLAHQMRQERAPCGPSARLHERISIKRASAQAEAVCGA